LNIPDKLPPLSETIPSIAGEVFSYMGSLYIKPESESANYEAIPDHRVMRCGFRLFEVLDWSEGRGWFKVQEFKATLTDEDLMVLSEQRRRKSET